MTEQNREVDLAVSALTAEIMKLTTLDAAAQSSLCITIENAFSRLALAILAQASNTSEACLAEAMPANMP